MSESRIEKRNRVKFGKARLYRPDVNMAHRLQFILFGLADPSHYLRSQYFKKSIHFLTPATIFDAGCGGGDYTFYMAEYWPNAIIDSVDRERDIILKNQQVQEKWRIKNINFQTMDLANLNLKEKYDLIISVDVLEYIVEQETVLANFYSALKPGGYLYLHIPLVRPKPEPLKKFLKNFHEFTSRVHLGKERTKDELVNILRSAHFNIVKDQFTFYYYHGELACSLFGIFFNDSFVNRIMQSFVAPIARILCYCDLYKVRNDGYAASILAQKA